MNAKLWQRMRRWAALGSCGIMCALGSARAEEPAKGSGVDLHVDSVVQPPASQAAHPVAFTRAEDGDGSAEAKDPPISDEAMRAARAAQKEADAAKKKADKEKADKDKQPEFVGPRGQEKPPPQQP